ncbi:MAG: CDP-alcohol phosphatidyltransferase family protein [Dehalococcoidia bacterium]|nr:CDP-alcohol phosphatidyltransferase family protein [Dehalococcoidia bacterium]
MIANRFKGLAQQVMAPLARIIGKTPITPNALTVTGFILNTVVAAVLATGHQFIGGLLVLFAGLFDMLDGALARTTGQSTTFGAFLDSTLDRYSEAVLLFGVLVVAAQTQDTQVILLVFAVMVGSVMVSYVRARAEGLGLRCEVGLLARPERVILLAVGLIIGQLLPVLWLLAIFTNITTVQRILHVRHITQDRGPKPVEGKPTEDQKTPEARPPAASARRPAARLID